MPLRTAFVSTYPPRRCGIATFTRDLANAVGDSEIAVLHPAGEPELYPLEVRQRIRRDVRTDYSKAAGALAASGVDVVSIQHEFGIYGGTDGAHVLDLVNALDLPVVATLHTVIRRPSPLQRRILTELGAAVDAVVVMSRAGARLLTREYGAEEERVYVIPHGVPDLPLVDPDTVKAELGLAGRPVILSFGLVGPGKGYELAVEALAGVVDRVPTATYVMLGATHPELLRRHGEAYREGLQRQVDELGLTDHVRFVDRFVGAAELGRWLQAADVFVTPYPNLEQIVSGTLSYALGAGKAIVSTPYAYAREVLAEGRGILVDPGSPVSMASAFIELLTDHDRREEMARRAYALGRSMVWRRVGAAYRALFESVVRTRRASPGGSQIRAVGG